MDVEKETNVVAEKSGGAGKTKVAHWAKDKKRARLDQSLNAMAIHTVTDNHRSTQRGKRRRERKDSTDFTSDAFNASSTD